MKFKIMIVITLIVLLLVLFIRTELMAEDEDSILTKVEFRTNASKVEKDVPIQIDVYIKNEQKKIKNICAAIEVNSNVFYELKEEDFEAKQQMDMFKYYEDDGDFIWSMYTPINEGVMATITLIPKVTINTEENINLLQIFDLEIVYDDDTEDLIEELDSTILVKKEGGIGTNEPTPTPTPIVPTPAATPLYLNSSIYSIRAQNIGTGDTTKYEAGDMFIAKVKPKTTVANFISALDTNGTAVVYKGSTIVSTTEFVGTGMTLKVTKDDEEIVLKIAVMGDVTGEGNVTATDLSKLNQVILGTNANLTDEYFIAVDLDNNNSITVTDLTKINSIILGTFQF